MTTDHPNYKTVDAFYSAFAKKDHATMRTFYAPRATFNDPVFSLSSAPQPADMWEMLCTRGRDMTMTYEIGEVTDASATVRWEARYTFSQTGRKVHNIVESTLKLEDGKIVRHVDVFDFWRWAHQALGIPGLLLGWSGFLKKKVQSTAMGGLKAYVAKRDA